MDANGGPASFAGTDEELTCQIAALANRLMARMWAHRHARVAELDLSMPEAKVLLALDASRALSVRQLAARLRTNPSSVSAPVGRLVARGLVRRQGADDRRVHGAVLTEAGAQLRGRLEARLLVDSPSVRGLTRDERLCLHAILRRLETHAGLPPVG